MKADQSENEYRLTTSGAGQILGVTGDAIVALHRRGVLECVRDSANRRLFRPRDIHELQRKRAARSAAA
jgi:DNA-binding transcriptional MerR regulator